MFAVIGTGDLTLGENLVLSGKIGTCPEGQKQDIDTFEHTRMVPGSYELVGPKDGTKDNNHTMNEFPSGTETVGGTTTGAFSGGGYSLGLKTSQGEFSYNVDDHATTPLPFELEEKNGKIYLKADVHGPKYLSVEGGPNFRIKDNIDNAVHIKDTSGNDVTSISNLDGSKNYLLYAAWCSRYISSGGINLYWSTSLSDAVNFGVSVDTEGGEEKNYVEIPSAKNDVGELTNYVKYYLPEKQTEANSALDKLNKEIDPIEYEYWTLPDGTGEFLDPNSDEAKNAINQYNQDHKVEQTYWVLPNGVEYTDKTLAEQALEQYYEDNPPSVACDIKEDAACPVEGYTNKMFTSGSVDSPKGFFIDIYEGKATLAGATLQHFYTSTSKDDTVKHVAPVVVNGGTFNIESGSINNNVVGYIVDDSKSNSIANDIKKYIKGAAPNAPRTKSSYRRWSKAGIDGEKDEDAGSGITGTAGAVIYTGKAGGTITEGTISYNRGDTGGIMVSGENTNVIMNGGTIEKNVGVQFGGGSFVEDGGFLLMNGGIMSENVAWFGGGAVFATENGIKWLLGLETSFDNRKDGKFVLNGGTLDNNTAFTRGGAILADSDGVALIKGNLSNNKARMLGGAVYVMGDDPNYTYTVYIKKGYVYNNRAVSGTLDRGTAATSLPEGRDRDDNMSLSKVLNTPCGCDYNKDYSEYNLFVGDMDKNSDDCVDGRDNDGTGGGVWLCAYGTSNINLNNEEFVINHNYASGSVLGNVNGQENKIKNEPYASDKTGGNDLHKDTKANGVVRFSGINHTDEEWHNENTGKLLTDEVDYHEPDYISNGLRNLINKGEFYPDGYEEDPENWDGVKIYENVSRRGGGLAADGTYIFGTTENYASVYAEMALDKIWNDKLPKEDVVIRVYVEKNNKKYFVEDVLMSENAKEPSELDTVFTESNHKSRFAIPWFVYDEKGNQIQVLNFKVDGRTLDLNNMEDLASLATNINNIELDSDIKFVFEEGAYDDDGNFVSNDKYNFVYGEVAVDEKTNADISVYKQQTGIDEYGQPIYSNPINISKSNIYLKNTVLNDFKPEIEKYVNEAVHKDINLDEVFTYDILAYVTMDADKVIITDQLVDELEFAPNNEVTILDIGQNNNHKVNNDVSGAATGNNGSVGIKEGDPIDVEGDEDAKATTISGDGVLVESDEGLLKVTLDNVVTVDETTGKISREFDTVTKLHGHWVKVTFQAQIKQDIQDKINSGEMTIKDLQNIKIKADEVYKDDSSIYPEGENRPEPNVGNAPVKSDEDHQGVINTASYVIEVLNEAKYQDESNTVTVKPEQPEVEKYVNQAVHKDIELDEVFTYDIIGLINKTADKVTFIDQLVDDLEIVDEDDIEVVYLDDNNHKPYNDISGNVINTDASVAQKGTSIKDEKGVTVEVKDNCLTVTLDDGVNPDGKLVKDLRGKYVKVTFKAQIKKELQDKIKAGEMKITDLSNVTVSENGLVLSKEEHNGIDNKAMMVTVGNDSVIEQETNVVTVGPEVVTVVVKKIWDDGNNADKIRPDTVTIILLADGKEVERVNITYNDNWTYTFANLVKSKDGKKIVYTVDEVSVKGYKKTINGYEITNTHIPDKPKKDYDIPKTGVK